METGKTLRGSSQLAVDAVEQVTNIVEGMYRNIAAKPLPWGQPPTGPARGIAGLVHKSIRGVTRATGTGIDAVLASVGEQLDQIAPPGPKREALDSVLNGIVGDHLVNSQNPLAIPMQLYCSTPVTAEPNEKWSPLDYRSIENPKPQLVIFVHGLCMNAQQWRRALPVAEGAPAKYACLGDNAEQQGYSVLYLRYNTGRHISENGADFADQLQQLVEHWPVAVKSIAIVGHSMGGLVTRSALLQADAQSTPPQWLSLVKKAIYLGSPHHGAVLERHGNWLQTSAEFSPYTAPLAALGMLRSAGITDLRYGNVQAADWQDASRFSHNEDRRIATKLTERAHGIEHYCIAASLSSGRGERIGKLLGDGLVHPSSATGRHSDPQRQLDFPAEHCKILYGTGHMDLLAAPNVQQQISEWLGPAITKS